MDIYEVTQIYPIILQHIEKLTGTGWQHKY